MGRHNDGCRCGDPTAPRLLLPCRITDMSKVSMSSRPEPGYENMDHFSINVDYVAEMLRTIEFQTGASTRTSTVVPRAPSPWTGKAPWPTHAPHWTVSWAQEWGHVALSTAVRDLAEPGHLCAPFWLVGCPFPYWDGHISPVVALGCPGCGEGEPWLTCAPAHRASG